jgi:two-component system chemotaxis response regulator CheY
MTRDEVSVLVVDDVNALRVQVRDLLKSFGFRKVTIASNGEEAKKFMGQPEMGAPFQLILADWQMAPVDGIELLKWVRAHKDYASVPFIMVTAGNTKDQVVTAVKAGVDDYLMKPLTIAQIQDKVYSLLVKKGIL